MRPDTQNPNLDRRADRWNSREQRVNWWLRLTSSGWERPQVTIADREHARRSRLASWIILGCLVADALLGPIGGSDTGSLVAIVAVGLALVGACVLNRHGLVTLAAGLIVIVISVAVVGALVSEPGGLLVDALPAYDLLVVSVVVAASILPRSAAFWVAAINITIICLDFFLQERSAGLQADLLTYPSPTLGMLSLLGRPIALEIIVATVAFLWVRGTDDAIARADRAEELAELERLQLEQRRQLEMGVQQLLETHVRLANGDYTARAGLPQDNQLWQVGQSLNNLVGRIQKANQGEYQLRRTEDELRRLAQAIDEARNGRRPVWPAPSGTAADLIIERVIPRARQPLPPAPSPQMGDPMRQASRRMPAPYPPQNGPTPLPGFPPFPTGPDDPAFQPMTGPLGPAWGQQNPYFNPNQRPSDTSGGGGSVISENPWFLPPEGDDS